MKRYVFGFACLLVLAVVLPLQRVAASSEPVLKVQIVSPECTLDTIDNGFGPTQVITCPPEAVDLIDTPEGIKVGDMSQPAANPQISLRLQSPANADDIGELLENSGIADELLNDTPRQGYDVRDKSHEGIGFVESFVFAIGILTIVLTFCFMILAVRKHFLRASR